MSSSSASQCRPKALISTARRCSGEALSRRGNQASGTPDGRRRGRPHPVVIEADGGWEEVIPSSLGAGMRTCDSDECQWDRDDRNKRAN
jgi:hypothetical protein